MIWTLHTIPDRCDKHLDRYVWCNVLLQTGQNVKQKTKKLKEFNEYNKLYNGNLCWSLSVPYFRYLRCIPFTIDNSGGRLRRDERNNGTSGDSEHTRAATDDVDWSGLGCGFVTVVGFSNFDETPADVCWW